MIDIKLIRDNPELVRKAVRDKNMRCDIDQVLAVDARRRALETEFNDLRHQQNKIGEQIAKAPKEEKAARIAEMGAIKQRVKELDEQREKADAELAELMLLVPQIPHPDAPIGPDASGNVEVRRHGTPKYKADFGFPFRDHLDLGLHLNIVDIDRGVKIAGSRNYVLRGAGAMLHEAVLRLAWDIMLRQRYGRDAAALPTDARGKDVLNFVPMSVPVLVQDKLMYGTGFFPLHREEVYLCERDGQSLVGTAEVPVTGYHMDEILEEAELPKLYVARSTCFRREAGAAGKDTRGLYRIHLFDKLEQVVLCRADADESARWHDVIIANAEKVLAALELPYRVLEVCTGDMGQGKVRMYDIETWMPSREAFSETHSASRFHDFQARRLNIRYRSEKSGKPEVCHTLNNTVIASPRILIPLLELNQNADGSVRVPAALRSYMAGIEVINP
ncbi:Serine--tRNA ligase [Phycisphaerae bacterium RAS1]|nr:Serine--tRNA ligase [Phycisphaerae bacterium RAS1]